MGHHWISVYPYWDQHEKKEKKDSGTLKHALKNMRRLVKKYGTPVMVVETGYEVARPEAGKEFLTKLIDGCLQMNGGVRGPLSVRSLQGRQTNGHHGCVQHLRKQIVKPTKTTNTLC